MSNELAPGARRRAGLGLWLIAGRQRLLGVGLLACAAVGMLYPRLLGALVWEWRAVDPAGYLTALSALVIAGFGLICWLGQGGG